MKRYTTEFKLEVVQRFMAGKGNDKLRTRRWQVPKEQIRTWVSHYRLHGVDPLRPQRSSSYRCWPISTVNSIRAAK